VRLLLNRNADFGLVNRGFGTALHVAVYKGLPEIATLLIERGANVNMFNRRRTTPLSFAVLGGDPVMVKILLDKGAQISNFNGLAYGDSLLRKAISIAKVGLRCKERATLRKFIETIVLLIKAGDNATGVQVPEEWKKEFPELSNALENTQKRVQEIEGADIYVLSGQTDAFNTMSTIGGVLDEYRGDFVNELESK
jgi:ankyrin repeat protein